MAIVTNGRLEYEMSEIDVTYPDVGKVTYRGSYPLIVPNTWTPPVKEYTDCLTFVGKDGQDFTLNLSNKTWDGTLEYSTDHENWNKITSYGDSIQSIDGKIYLRGSGNTAFYNGRYNTQIRLSAKAACYGNIQTLLQYDNPDVKLGWYCFYGLFNGCENLTRSPELPAIELTEYCYSDMFRNCTNLTTPPELPATTLSDGCYSYMFYGCTNLTIAPELPATTLAANCYSQMFMLCTNLISTFELPATTLPTSCYASMFQMCNKLKVGTTGVTKIFTCPIGTSSYSIQYMFQGTGGSFSGTPTPGTTYYLE